MIDRVFRVTLWTRLQKSSWRCKKKALYDSETEYKRGVKSYKRMVNRKQDGLLSAKMVCEEFLDGQWKEIEVYPQPEE